jgi:alkanesulfonate monooxygenase SsuD/methylene tetrahydromethanopterin reductase-like flavin-dependent oxidoreductase (luciferase family)
MRFGWLTLSLSPSPQEDAARIDQRIEQVCFAEQLGFGDVWLTEHYFTGESVYNDALIFASAIAMRTERIRIGFAVVQLPFHHPVQLALLDNPSKGRIDGGSARARSTTNTNLSAMDCAATIVASAWKRRSRLSDACGMAAR